MKTDLDNARWHLPWQIAHTADKALIGGILFKGGADERGLVEVGYWIVKAYQNRGYMTQAVGRIVAWALEQKNVRAVIAETDKDNIPSQRFLRKNGMKVFRETAEELWWTT